MDIAKYAGLNRQRNRLAIDVHRIYRDAIIHIAWGKLATLQLARCKQFCSLLNFICFCNMDTDSRSQIHFTYFQWVIFGERCLVLPTGRNQVVYVIRNKLSILRHLISQASSLKPHLPKASISAFLASFVFLPRLSHCISGCIAMLLWPSVFIFV